MTVAVPRPGPKTRQWLRALGISLHTVDSGGLTGWERAFQRSLYWNAKQLGISVSAAEAEAGEVKLRLQRQWRGWNAQGSVIAIRVADARDAELAVQRKPRSEQWTRNPEQQSGGQGSPKQRFTA